MKIAIIGGGITGLTAAYELTKRGHKVTIFEKEKTLGGLAWGFTQPNWGWHLEGAYHHLFTNDNTIIHLIHELGISDKLIIKRPITATYWQGKSYPLDSPSSLLSFPGLSLLDKVRTGLLIGALKINPFWKPLESITAKKLFIIVGGSASWRTLWEPLMIGKFGNYSDTVAASWLWARIKKRTPQLIYIAGGFHTLIETLEKNITKNGGKIITEKIITSLDDLPFDKILLTIPTPLIQKLDPDLSFGIGNLTLNIPHLHAQTLIIETKEPILKDTYWLNITDRTFPFLAVVAHTNFIEKKHYGNHHLTYFGNYFLSGHPYLSMKKNQLLDIFYPFILRLIRNSKFEIRNSFLFNGPFAQPVHQLHYSNIAPKLDPPAGGPNVCLANLDSIYPWDRGTNYAVELGQKAARQIENDG